MTTKPVVLDVRVVRGSGGGPDKTILNSPRFLEPAGYRMLCAYMHPPNDPGFEQLREKARASEAPLVSIEDRGACDWSVVTKLLTVCKRERVAVWHGHDYKSNAVGLILRRYWPMRLVTTVHGWVKRTWRTPLYYGIDRFCLGRYERVICVSEDLFNQCLECGVPVKRCLLIENAIDTRQYTRTMTTAEAKTRLGIPPHRFVIGAVGRLSEEKGFDFLIRAVNQLQRGGLDIELVIAGEGGAEPRLRGLCAELGCDDRVRFMGYQGDLPQVYQAMDVFALSSLREGLPNVLLEAMAMGVPVVSTRIAGIPRLIRCGHNGLLVNPGSVPELCTAVSQLIASPNLRAALATLARTTIEADYDFSKRMEKIRVLYDDLLAKDRDPTGLAREACLAGRR